MNTVSAGHAGRGGLQKHSIGDMYPYTIINQGKRAEWFCAFDTRTGNIGEKRHTYLEAQQDISSLKIRNMMHS